LILFSAAVNLPEPGRTKPVARTTPSNKERLTMGHTRKTEEQPEKQLWEQLDKVRAGMLGIEGSHSHMQPMAHQADKDGRARLWFFTSRESDLFRELGDGHHAHFCVIGKEQDYHACLMGDLHENRDRAKIDEYWNDHVAAWWSSKNDPDIALLEFDLLDAAIWASTKNPIRYAWEIQAAKDSEKEPDLGARAHVDFTAAKGSPAREESTKRH
jgi:general stress protein 26